MQRVCLSYIPRQGPLHHRHYPYVSLSPGAAPVRLVSSAFPPSGFIWNLSKENPFGRIVDEASFTETLEEREEDFRSVSRVNTAGPAGTFAFTVILVPKSSARRSLGPLEMSAKRGAIVID